MSGRPSWLEQLARRHAARSATAFLLYFNVADIATAGEGPPRALVGTLQDVFAAHGFTVVVRYSLSTGILCQVGRGVVADAARANGIGDLNALAPEQALPFLEHLLQLGGDDKIAVVIEHLQHVAPAGASDRPTRTFVETLLRMASSEHVEASANVVVALARNLGAVAPTLTSADSGWALLRVDLPDERDRESFLDRHGAEEQLPNLVGLDRDGLVEHTGGFRLAEMRRLLREAQSDGGTLDLPTVLARRAELVEAESEGLLTVADTRHGFDAVGGHTPVKRYFTELIRDGRLIRERAPAGVLFTGPPGTGKTHLAAAIAAECGMIMASMGEIRSRWVGDSERNLARVLDVIAALAPIVVFIDEIDQALGKRDEGQHGDSGVSGRMFSQILRFMSDPAHRGRVLWIAATNRADLLDKALLRRFQRVFPFLLPGPRGRAEILRAVASRTPERFSTEVDWEAVAAGTAGSTGDALETMLTRAIEIAGDGVVDADVLDSALRDFTPNIDLDTYRRQSLAALEATNFHSDWPDELPEGIAAEFGHEPCGTAG